MLLQELPIKEVVTDAHPQISALLSKDFLKLASQICSTDLHIPGDLILILLMSM